MSQCVLEFENDEAFGNALQVIFENGVSHRLMGSRQVLVDESSLNCLAELPYKTTEVVEAADLDASEIANLRKENLSFSY